MRYFSTFISGAGPIIERTLKKRPAEKLRIIKMLDGLVVYESSYTEREVRAISCFNNTFLYLDEHVLSGDVSVEHMIKNILRSSQFKKHLSGISSLRSFKVVTSLENQTVAVNRSLLQILEQSIERSTGARLNINRPEKELWFIVRSEGIGFAGLRLTYPYYKDKKPAKGELRPELAHVLSLASEPSPKDIVLDPFAGYGSIPFERAKSFPYKKIIANDNSAYLVELLKKRKASFRKPFIQILQEDALGLSSIDDSSIDKIITDPPWGIYDQVGAPLEALYVRMLEQFNRVLKPHGIAVVLTGVPHVIEDALSATGSFRIRNKYPLLVSGKKATLYVLDKQNKQASS